MCIYVILKRLLHSARPQTWVGVGGHGKEGDRMPERGEEQEVHLSRTVTDKERQRGKCVISQ